MSKQLPNGWVVTTLGEIVIPRGEKILPSELNDVQFIGMDDVESQTFRLLGSKPIDGLSSAVAIFEEGDILYGRLRPYLNKVYLAQFDGAASAEFIVIPPSEAIIGKYLLFLIGQQEFVQFAMLHSTGDRPRVKFEAIDHYSIKLPPLAEQVRIVANLDALLARTRHAREELEHVPALIEYYKQAILAAAFRGELLPQNPDDEPASQLLEHILEARRIRWETEQLAKYKEAGKTPPKNWEDKYSEPEAPDISDLPDLPESWLWVSIGQVFDVYVGSTPSRKKSEYWNGDIPWVSSGEVAFCRIDATRECITQLGLDNASTTVHPVGTILLGMIGEGKTRGQAAILDIPACHNQNSAAIRVSEAGLPSEFLYYFFKGTYDETRRKGAGNNQPALNKTRVQEMIIPLPPLNEQRRIIEHIEEAFSWLDIVLNEATSALRLLDHLEQATLEKAFRGELVPQDPNDEPASVLLERIREARAEQSNGSKRKKRK